jgi:hypothetical protein
MSDLTAMVLTVIVRVLDYFDCGRDYLGGKSKARKLYVKNK